MIRTMTMLGFIAGLISVVSADTFRHRETGEVFHGFRTQNRSGDKIIVYNNDEKKSQTIVERDYEITLDGNGRRNSIIRVPIVHPEALLSGGVAERIAQAIISASNNGPQLIVVEIDSPGGRGEYMRTVASAIERTTICPVVVFISGGEYAGAYAAAAVIALAADEVYIAPTAAIGAVGPMMGAVTNEQYAAFLNLYSPDTLAAYSGYAMGLVQRDAMRLLARALVDKSVSVVEVVDADGTRQLIERDNRQPTQTIVRTLAEGIPVSTYRLPTGEAAAGPLPAEVIGRVLTLTAMEAERIGLVNGQAASIYEIAVARGIADAQIVNAPDIAPTIRQFVAARRSIGQGLSNIEQLEDYAATLEEQIARVEDRLRTGTVTREVSRTELPTTSSRQRRERVLFPNSVDNYFGFDFGDVGGVTDPTSRTQTSSLARRQSAESTRIITDQPSVSLEVLRNEQVAVLNNLISEYRRVTNLARRWPGGLPPELPLQVLESNMNSASALLTNIVQYVIPMLRQQQFQQQQRQIQGQRPTTPRRY